MVTGARAAMMANGAPWVLELADVSHAYGTKAALHNVNISIAEGEIFGLLGPNGGGKTTLCRIISTTLKPKSGEVAFGGVNIWGNIRELRRRLGVVFQMSSLDTRLTVLENLRLQGKLHGLKGMDLEDQIARLLVRFRLTDRRDDFVRNLSGGLRRRLEVAKAFIHQPNFLLLDEPSTGLDPGARVDLWDVVQRLRGDHGVTVFMTTHLIDEADRCDRVAIIHRGRMVAMGTPAALKAEVGNDVVTVATKNPEELAQAIAIKYNVEVFVLDAKVRLGIDNGEDFARQVREDFPDRIDAVTVGKPTLEDVFIGRTGLRFGEEEQYE